MKTLARGIPYIGRHMHTSGRRRDFLRTLLVGLALASAAFVVPAAAQPPEPNPDAPCVDGVFNGDVQSHYQQILADQANPNGLFQSLSLERQSMIRECATRNAGRDADRYTLREVATDGNGNVIGRVYDYLDPMRSEVCQEAPLDPDCEEGQYYYVAVVLSGCYTDNVFGDDAYVQSVGWQLQGQGSSFIRLRQSDQVVAHASCTGSPGFSLSPLIVDLTGANSSTDGNGSIISDADSTAFNENVVSPAAAQKPFAFHAATSSVWNMLLSRWDVGDNNAAGTEERDGNEGLWTSPWPGADTASDADPANVLCSGLTCDLGYATTWFDNENRWEWQVVYEMRWDASSCTPPDPDFFDLDFDQGTHASPNKRNFELCGDPANLGALTLIKDSLPDNPWNDFRFTVTGPTPGSIVLQDPGAAECVAGNEFGAGGTPAACDNPNPWNAEDRFSWTDLVPTDNPITPRGPYRVAESAVAGTDLTGYDTRWECRNVNPTLCTASFAASVDDPFAESECNPVATPGSCNALGLASGSMTGDGLETPDFSICRGAHVICQFTNEGGEEECVESANAIGDLQVFGAVQPDNVAFATGAVPVQSADAADSMFMASFTPLADVSRWPGNVDHFILPLPVIENADGQVVPDSSQTCAGEEDTACLAWRAGDEILDQAPTPATVGGDRRIGDGIGERRITYTQGESGTALPRSIRAFDWAVSDSIADEHDLWNAFGLSYVANDPTSEQSARTTARSIVNQTLQIRESTVPDPLAPTGLRTFSSVAGDFFHSDPLLVAGPQNFFYLANDLEGNGEACDAVSNPNRGYRCFFEEHRRRRRVLLAGSNDGQLHAFDAGIYQGDVEANRLVGQYTFGSGKEVFAHIPRQMLLHTAEMTTGEHDFGVDGSLTVDDFFIDSAHGGTPAAADREWRTVVVGSYREGGRGHFALDLTQPDVITQEAVLDFAGNDDTEYVPDAEDHVPGCTSINGTTPGGCGTLPYPAVLWEFTDECTTVDPNTNTTFTAPCDDDNNLEPDLGQAWSQVNTGRILVNLEGVDDPVAKYVAVFGGGLDPDHRTGGGNFLYMVDVETGKAIYKRQLTAGAPSEPAAVDIDQDGFLDTIYIGTVDGLMHKVDISDPADLTTATGRIDDPTQWTPFAIFDTEGRPIFYPPTVLFVASQGAFAIAFGTGDREDLFSEAQAGQEGRFYTLLDPGFQPDANDPTVRAGGVLTESSFQPIVASDLGQEGVDFLAAPPIGRQPGWVLQLGTDERVVTKALALSGLMVFTTFRPETGLVCEYGGNGSIYALLATNANSIAGADQPRALAVEGFAGRPVVMPTGMSQSTGQAPGETIDPFEAARIEGIRRSLMDLFPSDCRFGNFSLNVGVTLSNTSQVPIASVPVCVARRNWTEHF